MSNLQYHRPKTLDEALRLLARPGAAPLAGGTRLVPALGETTVRDAVDLQAVGLTDIDVTEAAVTLGAMLRLQTLAADDRLPPLLRQMARREGPNTTRHAATLGGAIATADWESELFAALLVHEAVVTVRTAAETRTLPLADWSAAALAGGGLVTAVTLRSGGQTAAERVARTPADRPIVAAVARQDAAGRLHLALCGVAKRPILVAPDAVDGLTPPADFRGSSAYRLEMARLLSRRVLDRVRKP
ncbi:MAG: FAD binding domain-containing protein [Anaerolineales bacterium]|nr:FAD binding domain-containing protein [Anaerolineales bacterium]